MTKNEGKVEKMTKEENNSNSETALINREVLEKIFSFKGHDHSDVCLQGKPH